MTLLNKKQINSFKKWLTNQGSDVLQTLSEYELVRFECKLGTGVIYTGRKGQSVSGDMVHDAISAFLKSKKWEGNGRKIKNRASKKNQLINRDGTECFYCGNDFKPEELTQEHMLSVVTGGSNHMANLVLACERCNKEADKMAIIDKVRLRDKKRETRNIISNPSPSTSALSDLADLNRNIQP